MSEKKTVKKKSKTSTAGASASRSAATGPMDVEFLQQIVKVMSANDLNTVDLRDGDRRVVLKRGVEAGPTYMTSGPAMQYAPQAPAASPPSSSTGGPTSPPDDTAGLVPIKSPMVGTFYAKPSPDAKPFVAVGSTVDEDTDVCVIEAMKVFNNIKAETRGTIARILVAEGQTVEFGTVLFFVKP